MIVLYTVLITIAGLTDATKRLVPNALSWIAVGIGATALMTGWWSWPHLVWALAGWVLFDITAMLFPQGMGYGDVKTIAWTLGFWPGFGIVLILGGMLWTVLYGTVDWWRHRPSMRWSQATAPWVVGVTLTWWGFLGYHYAPALSALLHTL